MGLMKNLGDARADARRYNAARRRAARLAGDDSSRLIRLETISETERYQLAQDADRVTAFNKAVEQWAQRVTTQLRATIASRSLRIARELHPNLYTDRYGLVNRVGFSFPRHGIYIHKGAYKGHGGFIGSKWEMLKRVGGQEVSTGIVRHTNPDSLGKQGTGARRPFQWFDPVIRNRIGELEAVVLDYFDTMVIDATNIYINR
ncbi:MAG TPA: hypothetical protein H9824_06035 [Candidatus Bacteroides pullicola]|uniref:Uncharacterized protein n=1 Tax=Candidatus Bacteroides pullicola TaxID=2838475 RepID=A0A9D1ZH39_9BACE|nr:hypothetical protein [Candidatus Bacteroides pullicola]